MSGGEDDDDSSQDDAYLSSSSTDTPRSSKSTPTPHVAIRVAKAAYYNSKTTQNQMLKSNIFKTGGFRGNFFSQVNKKKGQTKLGKILNCLFAFFQI